MMKISEQFEDLMSTEMDRQEFLTYVGAALLAVLGVSGLLRTLANPRLPHQSRAKGGVGGYGSGTYGGRG